MAGFLLLTQMGDERDLKDPSDGGGASQLERFCSGRLWLLLKGQLLDRESLRVNRFYQVNTEAHQRPGYDKYRMHYQAKNTFGGYVTERGWLCRLPKS